MTPFQRFFDGLFMFLMVLLPKRPYSRLIGRLADWRGGLLSRTAIRIYAALLKVDVEEAEFGLNYDSVQSFFTRRLKPGARPIRPEPEVLVSSTDGTVGSSSPVTQGRAIQVKGIAYELDELLGDAALARRFEGGCQLTVYLSPRNYHRIHAPCGGKIVRCVHVPGALWPVNGPAVRSRPIFAVNERIISVIETPSGKLVSVVKVGAVGVGRIGLSYLDWQSNQPDVSRPRDIRFDSPIPVEKGAELGVFNLGSTVVMVFEPGAIDLDPPSMGSPIRMGERIGRRPT